MQRHARRGDHRAAAAAHRLHPASGSGSPPTRRNAAAPASGSSPPTASRTTATGPGRLDAIVADAAGDAGRAPVLRRLGDCPPHQPRPGPPARGRAGRLLAGPGHRPLADRRPGRAETGAGQRRRRRPRPAPVSARRVIPYVQDRRNILVFQLASPGRPRAAPVGHVRAGARHRGGVPAGGLRARQRAAAAGRRARATGSCSPSPPRAAPGVLRRLQAEPDALAQGGQGGAARSPTSTRTPATTSAASRETARSPSRAARAATTACSATATSRYHELIDRHRARDLLLAIAGGVTLTDRPGRVPHRAVHRADRPGRPTLEEEFVQWLKDHGYRLPDAAQVTVAGAYARPDFIYRLPSGPVAVFVDGPVHDDAGRRRARRRRRRTAGGRRLVRDPVPARRRLAGDRRREPVRLRRSRTRAPAAAAAAGGRYRTR